MGLKENKHLLFTGNVVIIAMLFVCCLITSNILELKFAYFNFQQLPGLSFLMPELHITCGLMLFPFTYFFSDVLTEVYGFKVSRLVIWSGLFCLLITNVFIAASVALPASDLWGLQSAYEAILGSSFRIFIASLIAYFIGELLNATVLSKLKVVTRGRFLWFRASFSTFLGNTIDTTLFFHIAFYNVLPFAELWNAIMIQIILKTFFEFAVLPATYWVSNYLKQKDGVDVYEQKPQVVATTSV